MNFLQAVDLAREINDDPHWHFIAMELRPDGRYSVRALHVEPPQIAEIFHSQDDWNGSPIHNASVAQAPTIARPGAADLAVIGGKKHGRS